MMVLNHIMENMTWNYKQVLGNVMEELYDLPKDNLLRHERDRNPALAHHQDIGSFLHFLFLKKINNFSHMPLTIW